MVLRRCAPPPARGPDARRLRLRPARETASPIDRKRVRRREPYLYDTSGPERDRETRPRQVDAAAVRLPEDVARLISRIRERLDEVEDTDPLTASRIVGALDAVVETDGPYATHLATRRHTDEEIAVALGSTGKARAARPRRYDGTRCRPGARRAPAPARRETGDRCRPRRPARRW
ncbi:hypothetical protein [Streptomyces sp. NPDC004284]|uniref:hypothetical protein n=1 Tax=Streptomyces sp. NPDC004284 TaxID=3364695 RepID=UPI0036B504DE